MKVRKKISMKDFVELWKNIEDKDWEEVVGNWQEEGLDAWKEELMSFFQLDKKNRSFGSVPMSKLHSLLKQERPSVARIADYTNEAYMKAYPKVYVKHGDLKTFYGNLNFFQLGETKSDSISVKAFIPMKEWGEDPDPEGYVRLEESRSFLKSSLVLAWPEIVKRLLENIGK